MKRMNNNCREKHIMKLSRIAALVSILLLPFLWAGGGNAADQDELTYTMSRGDNLWNITERYLKGGFLHWNPLILHNKIIDPKHMPPGTKLRIPLPWLKTDPATVRVRDVYGEAQLISAQQTEPQSLGINMLLKEGDEIMVGEGGNVVLEFSDQSKLFLGSGSQMKLVQIRKFSDSGLADSKTELNGGRSETKVKTRNTRFQIKTPSANTTVRGTDFRVTVDRDNLDLSRIEVLGGRVHVGSSGGALNVKAGFGTTVSKNEAPSSLVKLLEMPKIQSPPSYSRDLPVDIKWHKVDGARQYRIQIYKAAGEQTLLVDKVIPIPRFNTSEMKDGNYIIRVRAIDANGLEGKNAEHTLQLDARPQPPLAISPRADETVRTELPKFEWAIPTGRTGYHFQLSEHSDLSSPLIDSTEFTGTTFTPEQLTPGIYYWRMATFAGIKKGPFSHVQSFTLQPAPKAPDLSKMSTEEDESNITLRWQAGTTGQQYKVQLAEDSDFKKILKEEQLQLSEFTTERPSQITHFRIKVIDIDGFEGDWSPAQQIEQPLDPWYYFLIPTIPFLTAFLLAL